jgi:hypothetical protein
VEPSLRRPLGRPVQRVLQSPSLVHRGVVGPLGHAPTPLCHPTHERSRGPSLRRVVLSTPMITNMAPSDAHPARRDFPFDGYTHRTLPDRRPGAGEGLSSSRHHLPNVPRPITAGGSSALRFQDLHAFHGLRPDTPDSAPPWSPHRVGLTPRQTSLHAADRSVAPTMWLSTLGSDAGRFPPTPPACYQAPWRLPGRDFHPLAVTN